MQSRWSDAEAEALVAEYAGRVAWCNEDVALRTYSARLLGADAALVSYGGGNTSVKTILVDDDGASVHVLSIKGSGHDLATIAPEGHVAIRLAGLAELRALDSMSDEVMVRIGRSRRLDPDAATPSVEFLAHAFLPHRFIDHSHADAVLALADQDAVDRICGEVYGDRLAVVPYVMPGFALAKAIAEAFERNPEVEGLLLHRHGLFTFGATARESYERHIAAVTNAEDYIAQRRGGRTARSSDRGRSISHRRVAPLLRGALGRRGRRFILEFRDDEMIRGFVDDPELESLALRGPATPDHVIRTKRLPLILHTDAGMDEAALGASIDAQVGSYRDDYREYFQRQTSSRGVERVPLDPEPRVVLVPGLGLIAAGRTAGEARAAAELYTHTIAILRDAEAVGRYQPLAEADLFDMEYWPLEQAKLSGRRDKPLTSRVVFVTGAASGIGAAVARRFAAEGAHLFLVDRDASVEALAGELGAACATIDVTDRDSVLRSMAAAVDRFGGVDGVVSNAGSAGQVPIRECVDGTLEASLALNLLAHQWVAAAATEVMRTQGTGGFLLFNASKAAVDPGRGFGAYAVAKAALLALMRQYALEEGDAGIRACAVNADRVRTGLLSAEDVSKRERARGLEPGAYYRSNLLRREVTTADVAQAFLTLALAESTTGAILTVDGGNLAAAPR